MTEEKKPEPVKAAGKVLGFLCGMGALEHVEELPKACPAHPEGVLETGFGLAFGGYGEYVFCRVEGCGFFAKRQEKG